MSRTRGVSLLVAALVAVLAGCGAKADLTKATYQRTTVPAGIEPGGGGTSGTQPPKTNDAAFAADQLRKIDPCRVLDKDLLSTVGTPKEHSGSDFSQCSNFMQDPDGKDLNITLTLGEGLLEDPKEADKNSVGGLPAIEQELDDKSACFQTAITETSPTRGIKVQIGGEAADKCGIGRKVLEGALTRIRTDPPMYDLKPSSLIEVDPCRVVSEADIGGVLGSGVKVTPTSLHWCSWGGDGADVWVWLRNGVDPAAIADPAKTTKVNVGVDAIQEQDLSSSAKCDVSWAHLPLQDDFAEVADVTFIRYTPQQGEDVCAKAQTIAKALVPKLPKK